MALGNVSSFGWIVTLNLIFVIFLFCGGDEVYGEEDKSDTSKNETNMMVRRTEEAIFGDKRTTLEHFDADKDEKLNREEFTELCALLFRDKNGEPYKLENDTLDKLFTIFDIDKNGFIGYNEFTNCFHEWIQTIINPTSVLVIVDVQNDFITGSLSMSDAPAKEDGAEVIGPINEMVDTVQFNQVIYTLDWHPPDHISFVDNVKLRKLHETSKFHEGDSVNVLDTVVFKMNDGTSLEQTLWPRHAVQNTTGAELHPDLKIPPESKFVYKGTNPNLDAYSALLDNEKRAPSSDLKMFIDEANATDVYVCGLATDFCAGATALDSLLLGYRTVFVEDAARGVSPDGIIKRKQQIRDENGVIVKVTDVDKMVNGVDRRPELGLYWALQVEKARNGKDE